MVAPDRRKRAERQDDVPQRPELDDQDLPRPRPGNFPGGPQPGQSRQIDVLLELFESLKDGGVRAHLGRADAGEQFLYQLLRRSGGRRNPNPAWCSTRRRHATAAVDQWTA